MNNMFNIHPKEDLHSFIKTNVEEPIMQANISFKLKWKVRRRLKRLYAQTYDGTLNLIYQWVRGTDESIALYNELKGLGLPTFEDIIVPLRNSFR